MHVHICDVCGERLTYGKAHCISFFENNGLSYMKAHPRIEVCDFCFKKIKEDYFNGEGSFTCQNSN